jgi:hypothetical protein
MGGVPPISRIVPPHHQPSKPHDTINDLRKHDRSLSLPRMFLPKRSQPTSLLSYGSRQLGKGENPYPAIPAPEGPTIGGRLGVDDLQHAFDALLGRDDAVDFPVEFDVRHVTVRVMLGKDLGCGWGDREVD